MLELDLSKRFRRDYKIAEGRGLDVEELWRIVELLLAEKTLPPECRDHPLQNSRGRKKLRDCHVSFDWVLIYKVQDGVLKLVRTGTHSDVFKN